MSAIAVPPSPRSTSRSQSRRRAAGQASCRPRLRLVTEDFVPEVRSRLEGDETGLRSAPPASPSPTPPTRLPAPSSEEQSPQGSRRTARCCCSPRLRPRGVLLSQPF